MQHHKFEALDGLRGILALTIAAYHFKILWHFKDTDLLNSSFMAVDFFFVLSGFVITHASLKYLHTANDGLVFTLRRIGRVWPLHIAILIGFILNELIKLAALHHGIPINDLPFDPTGQNSLATLPANILLLQGLGFLNDLTWNTPGWSISTEFYTYLLFAVSAILAKKHFPIVALGLITVSSLILLKFGAGIHTDFFRCVAGFFLGYFVYRFWEKTRTIALPYASLLEAACIVGMLTFAALSYTSPVSMLAPLCVALPVYVFARQQGAISKFLTTRPLQKLGLWSYGIYMVHTLVLVFISQAITAAEKILKNPFHTTALKQDGTTDTPIFIVNLWATDALMLAYLCIVLLTAALSYRLIENPARHKFNHLAKSSQKKS